MTTFLLALTLAIPSPATHESILMPRGLERVALPQVGGTAADPCTWSRWNFAALIGYGTGQGTDVGTTSYGLGADKITEANPVLRPFLDDPPWVLPGVKMGLAGLSTYALARLSCHHPRLGGWTTVGLTLVQAGITWHNSRLLRE